MTTKRPPAPKTLGPAGRELWRQLNAKLDFDEHERALVLTACRQADAVAELERLVAEQGLEVAGSVGQTRLHPAIAEARQGRLALAKLISSLAIPVDEDAKPMTATQRRAAHAANTRWTAAAQKRAARG